MPATLGRASKTKTVNGRIVSAKSKTGDSQCSQAVSDWKRNGMTPLLAAILGKCRASAHARKKADMHEAAGNTDKAALLRRKAENTAPTNAAQRLERAKALRGQRAEKQGASKASGTGKTISRIEGRYHATSTEKNHIKAGLAAGHDNFKIGRKTYKTVESHDTHRVLEVSHNERNGYGKTAPVSQRITVHYEPSQKTGAGKATQTVAAGRHTPERLARAKAIKEQRMGDRQALEGYTASDYRTINTVLRGQGKAANSDVVQSKIAAIDRATNKRLNKDTTLYRGLDVSVLKGLDPKKLVGRTVPSQGFTSTSTSQDVAYRPDFNKGVIIKINAPKGTRGATIHGNTGEKEVVLARNTQLKFTHVSKGGVDDTGKRVTILHADVAGSSVHAPGRNTPMRLDRAKELKAQRSAKQAASSAPSIPAPKGPTALQSLIKSKSAGVVKAGVARVERRQATLKAAAEFKAKDRRYADPAQEAAYRNSWAATQRARRNDRGSERGISRESLMSYRNSSTEDLHGALKMLESSSRGTGTRSLQKKYIAMTKGILAERKAAHNAKLAAARAIPRGTDERKLIASNAKATRAQGYSTREALMVANTAHAVRSGARPSSEIDKYIKEQSKIASRRLETSHRSSFVDNEKLTADHNRITSAASRRVELAKIAKTLSKVKRLKSTRSINA